MMCPPPDPHPHPRTVIMVHAKHNGNQLQPFNSGSHHWLHRDGTLIVPCYHDLMSHIGQLIDHLRADWDRLCTKHLWVLRDRILYNATSCTTTDNMVALHEYLHLLWNNDNRVTTGITTIIPTPRWIRIISSLVPMMKLLTNTSIHHNFHPLSVSRHGISTSFDRPSESPTSSPSVFPTLIPSASPTDDKDDDENDEHDTDSLREILASESDPDDYEMMDMTIAFWERHPLSTSMTFLAHLFPDTMFTVTMGRSLDNYDEWKIVISNTDTVVAISTSLELTHPAGMHVDEISRNMIRTMYITKKKVIVCLDYKYMNNGGNVNNIVNFGNITCYDDDKVDATDKPILDGMTIATMREISLLCLLRNDTSHPNIACLHNMKLPYGDGAIGPTKYPLSSPSSSPSALPTPFLSTSPTLPSIIPHHDADDKMTSMVDCRMAPPNNYIGNEYIGIPIAITAEGANIMTSLQAPEFEESQAVENFTNKFNAIVGHGLSNFFGSTTKGLSYKNGDKLLQYHEKQLLHFSNTFALTEDLCFPLGGKLKFEELLMGRLDDALGPIYLGYATLHHYSLRRGVDVLEALTEHTLLRLETEAQDALKAASDNFPGPLSPIAGTVVKLE